MATRGVKITGLNTLPNVAANTVLVSVDLATDETLQTNVQSLANFVLNEAGNLFPVANVANTVRNNAQPNITSVGTLTSLTVAGVTTLGPVGNVRISGGNAGQILQTYGNGTLYWGNDSTPGQPNNSVQFNLNNSFAGSSNFTFDSSSNLLSVTNIDVGNISANNANIDTLFVGNFNVAGAGNGTQQQVLGIVNQTTQQLGWKTVPVYYITVDMRDGSSYQSSPNPVLRVYPVQQRNGSFVNLNTTQL